MRKILFQIIILSVFSLKGQTQNDRSEYNYFVPKNNTQASDSRIEVLPNGDTVLISKYVLQNQMNNSRQNFEKIYKGTPFFNNKWAPGVLYFEDGSVINGTMAYNLVNNSVYYSLGNISNAIEAKPIGFTIGEYTFSKLNEKYQFRNLDYFQMIFGGLKVDMFRKYSCIYRPEIPTERTGYDQEKGPYEGIFDKMTKLFLGWNGNIIELKTTNGIYRQFGDYKVAMEKYGKENKVNLKKEEDIIKLVVYFSQLVEEFDK